MTADLTTPSDVPRFVTSVLRRAAADGLTDLYLLPGDDAVVIQGRHLSGDVCDVARVPGDVGDQCAARLKVMAGMLTYRTTAAQDGAIHGLDGCTDVEFRLATLPTRTGERLTVRLLRRGDRPQFLDDLGFSPAALERLRDLLHRPHGLAILTGPTGSGKTTTIYAMVRELLREGHSPASLITIEDPVECRVPGISQVQIRREDPDWDYARALRAALRHDVKTLVIGELRDREVTRVALDAALTGHRVITTYHAGDVAGVVARLLHQGFEPFLVAAAVSGVAALRLVPRSDGEGVRPVAAALTADDSWRDAVIANPGLGALRRKVREISGADIEREMATARKE